MKPLLSSIQAYWQLCRSTNGVIAGFSTWLGWYCTSTTWNWQIAIADFVIMWSLVSIGNIHNDIVDVETDSINQPTRPIPSGRVSQKSALLFTLIFTLFTLTLSALAHPQTLLATVGILVLLFTYNKFLKGTVLFGNVLVSILCAIPLLFSTIPHFSVLQVFLASFAFCFNLAREITKDVEDLNGDKLSNIQTIAVSWGVKKASIFIKVTLVFGLTLSLLPLYFGLLNWLYFICWLLGPFLFSFKTFQHLEKLHWKKAQKTLKIAMLMGMIAIYMALLCR